MRRRDFIKNSVVTSAGFAIAPQSNLFSHKPDQKVQLGIIGTGLRGQNHLGNALFRKDVDIVAICDVDACLLF